MELALIQWAYYLERITKPFAVLLRERRAYRLALEKLINIADEIPETD